MTKNVQSELPSAMGRAYVAAFRWLRNREDALDACQEAAAKAVAASSQYDERRPFYPWFYRILKNHCLDQLRRASALPMEKPDAFPARTAGAEMSMLQTEEAQLVGDAIDQLDGELKELIELRHFQDLSYQAIAEVLDVPIGTVMSRLYRARKQLREQLQRDPRYIGSRT